MKLKSFLYLIIFSTVAITGCKNPDPLIRQDEAIQKAFQNSEKAIRVAIMGRQIVSYVMVKERKGWQGYRVEFLPMTGQDLNVASITGIEPVAGWEDFEFIVDHLNIIDLPDQKEIESHSENPATDLSYTYLFRVNNGEEIRMFNYSNPEAEIQKNWQSKNVVIFGAYLMTEFEAAK